MPTNTTIIQFLDLISVDLSRQFHFSFNDLGHGVARVTIGNRNGRQCKFASSYVFDSLVPFGEAVIAIANDKTGTFSEDVIWYAEPAETRTRLRSGFGNIFLDIHFRQNPESRDTGWEMLSDEAFVYTRSDLLRGFMAGYREVDLDSYSREWPTHRSPQDLLDQLEALAD